MAYVDVMGRRFGSLVVSGQSERKSLAGKLWVCSCDCGGHAVTTSLKLRTGHTTSCGCYKRSRIADASRTHGRSKKDRTYKSWKQMRQRCNNPNSDQWEWYGGKGISICPEWNSFEQFVADMGERPEGMTLDRKDGSGNYEPTNCRWATAKQQAETNRGLIKPGSRPPNRLPDAAIESIRAMRFGGATLKTIAAAHSVSIQTVWHWCR